MGLLLKSSEVHAAASSAAELGSPLVSSGASCQPLCPGVVGLMCTVHVVPGAGGASAPAPAWALVRALAVRQSGSGSGELT